MDRSPDAGPDPMAALAERDRLTVLVLSDTHAPSHWTAIPKTLIGPLRAADVVLHAGDVCRPGVLDDLAATAGAPVLAVLGNNDGADVAAWGPDGVPERREFVLAGMRFAMVHDSGARVGRGRRMRAWFPAADVVVYGHSHLPYDGVEDGLRLVNPGSAGDRRSAPTTSYAVLELAHGRIAAARIVPLG
ncbi:MAG: metallophosphatase family protein [Actinobacteria bacterium]|nr:metallophosphatase family protein [Actinomycetota bacterium]